MKHDKIDALGYVEVHGLAAAIETADAMLKSAEVCLLRQLLRDPAQITIVVEGSLGACRAAIDAGQASATRMGAFIASQVMGRPARDTADFVLTLAEAGRQPFSQKSAPSASIMTAAQTEKQKEPLEPADDAQILSALAGFPGGFSAQNLARRIGGRPGQVKERLEALCASGKLAKHQGRYALAEPHGVEP